MCRFDPLRLTVFSIKFLLCSIVLFLVTSCERKEQPLLAYTRQFKIYYEQYKNGSIKDAEKAMHSMIELEKNRAQYLKGNASVAIGNCYIRLYLINKFLENNVIAENYKKIGFKYIAKSQKRDVAKISEIAKDGYIDFIKRLDKKMDVNWNKEITRNSETSNLEPGPLKME